MTPFFYDRLAYYVRAVNALGASEDAEAQRAIAQILGLIEPPSPAPVQKVAAGAAGPAAPLPPGPDRKEPQAAKTAPAPSAAPAPRPRKRKPVSYTVETATAATRERPSWLNEPGLLEPPRAAAPPPAQPVPLLRPRWSRAILSTAMATRTEINQVDVAAVLDAEVQGKLLRRIPRRIVPSLSRGVQVLVDLGPSSEPFRADHELLLGQIRSVGGRDTVSVIELDSSRDLLASDGDGSGDNFEQFRPPPGVVVMLVSDLGIVRVPFEETALPSDWLRFVTRLRAGGNPVIAFVPFGPHRWPPALARTMAMVQWDRTTNVQAVRRAMRKALR